jgi:hypothetical protein
MRKHSLICSSRYLSDTLNSVHLFDIEMTSKTPDHNALVFSIARILLAFFDQTI